MTSVTGSVRWPWGRALLVIGLAATMISGVVVMRAAPEGVITTVRGVVQALRDLGGVGLIAFALLQAFIAVSGVLPASLLGVAAGTIYGFFLGSLLAAGSTMLGAMLAFFLSRSAFRPVFERLASHRSRLQNLDALIERDGWKLVCLLRISPIMPFAAASYLLGLSSISFGNYMLGTLGSLPALAGYVFLGTLANAGLFLWVNGSHPVYWLLLGLGGLATLALTIRMGQIAFRAGFIPHPDGLAAAIKRRPPPHPAPDSTIMG